VTCRGDLDLWKNSVPLTRLDVRLLCVPARSTFTVPIAEYAIMGKKDMFCVTSSMVCEVMSRLTD